MTAADAEKTLRIEVEDFLRLVARFDADEARREAATAMLARLNRGQPLVSAPH